MPRNAPAEFAGTRQLRPGGARPPKIKLLFFRDLTLPRAGTALALRLSGPHSLGSNVMRTLPRAFAATVAALSFICAAVPQARADEPYRVTSTSRIKDLANI